MPFSIYRRGRKGDDTSAPDLFIATPCNSGRPCANYVMSMADTAVYLTENNVKFDYWLHTEDCHVDDARNTLVKQFLESGAPYLVFIDDDVGWDTVNLAKLIAFDKGADIVGGAYPLKQPQEDYPIRLLKTDEGGGPTLQARPDGLLQVAGVPTGFMRVARRVVEALMEKRKHMKFFPRGADTSNPAHKITVIFERTMVDGHRWSGDLNFCREARLLGFKIWCDPEMRFTHMGHYRWDGCFGHYLRKTQNILDGRLDLAIEKLATGDDSIENFCEINRRYGELFAMGGIAMQDIYRRCKDATGPILECGSGITTIIAGLACQRNGQMVHALEHDLEYFNKTKRLLQRWKIKAVALHYSPLKEYPEHDGLKGNPLIWYGDLEDLPEKFDVAIIDGPQRKYGRDGVYKLMMDRIKGATWIVDDCEDGIQLKVVNKYAEEAGKKVELKHPKLPPAPMTLRHHAIVT